MNHPARSPVRAGLVLAAGIALLSVAGSPAGAVAGAYLRAAGATPATPPAAPDEGSPGPTAFPEAVDSLRQLAEMWGHLEASRANAQAGDWALALLHAGHPVVEYWAVVERVLTERGLVRQVRDALDRYQRQIESRSPRWRESYEAAVASLRHAMQALAGPDGSQPALRARVVVELLNAVEAEYSEGVQGGRIAHLAEYQDAWGFFRVARALYGEIASAVRTASGEAATAIERELGRLEGLFARARPERAPGSVAEVAEAAGAIRAELARVLSVAAEPQGPQAIIAAIREQLHRSLAAYRAGQRQEAYELAVSAYLDGFERLEAELLRRGQRRLVEELEGQFKELRDAARAGRPAAELERLARAIESGLMTVLGVLR